MLFVGHALLLNGRLVGLLAAPGLLALLRVHHAVAEGAAQQVVCLLVQLLVLAKRQQLHLLRHTDFLGTLGQLVAGHLVERGRRFKYFEGEVFEYGGRQQLDLLVATQSEVR